MEMGHFHYLLVQVSTGYNKYKKCQDQEAPYHSIFFCHENTPSTCGTYDYEQFELMGSREWPSLVGPLVHHLVSTAGGEASASKAYLLLPRKKDPPKEEYYSRKWSHRYLMLTDNPHVQSGESGTGESIVLREAEGKCFQEAQSKLLYNLVCDLWQTEEEKRNGESFSKFQEICGEISAQKTSLEKFTEQIMEWGRNHGLLFRY